MSAVLSAIAYIECGTKAKPYVAVAINLSNYC